MKRQNLVKTTVALAIAVTGLSTLVFAGRVQAKPNVLWILTDDQRIDSIQAFNRILHNQDHSELGHVESPNVDRLAAWGTTFINTYVHAQGCAPSRASMHYGRYPFRSGVYEFEYHNRNADHWKPSLPEQMQQLGYQTFHVGKLGVRIRNLVNGKATKYGIYETDIDFKKMWFDGATDWTKGLASEVNGIKIKGEPVHCDWFFSPGGMLEHSGAGLDEIEELRGHSKRIDEKYDLLRGFNEKIPFQYGSGEIIGGVSPQPAGKTRDGTYTRELINFLGNPLQTITVGSQRYMGVDPSKPLFAHIGYDFPHTPVLPPKSYRARFQTKTYAVPEFDKDEKQKQPWMIVYVCGDHGWKLNDHGAISKFSPWRIDSNNPIIVVSSDKQVFPAGKVVTEFTEFVDMMPTMLAAAGADLSSPRFDYLDGYDLAKVTSGQLAPRDYVIGESHAVTGPRATIRTKEYMFSIKSRPDKQRGKRMDWAMKAGYEELEPVLYHLPSDPHELHNLAFRKEYEPVAQTLNKKLLNIVIGDGRVEVDWGTKATGTKPVISNFASGADDKQLDTPSQIN